MSRAASPAPEEGVQRAGRADSDGQARRIHRASGAIRLWQVDRAQLHRRPAEPVGREHLARSDAHRYAAPGEARIRDGVPELRAVPAHERREERRFRLAHARRHRRRCRREGRACDEAGSARRSGAQAPGPALRRAAAARGDRSRDRHRAAAHPDGRAAVEPRREAADRDARRNPPHPPRARPSDDLRHARPGRGPVAG